MIMVPFAAIRTVPTAALAWHRLQCYTWYRYSDISKKLHISCVLCSKYRYFYIILRLKTPNIVGMKYGSLLRLPQFYTILRMLLHREPTPQRRLLLLARILDRLEQDYTDAYPNDEPIFDGSLEQLVRDLLIPK